MSISITQGFGYLAGMLTMKVFPLLIESIGFNGTVYFYAALSIVMLIWGIATIPNMEDLSLVEVERMHDKRLKHTKTGARESDFNTQTTVEMSDVTGYIADTRI